MSSNFLMIFVCGKCCLFITVNLAFLVIGILVGSGSTQQYGGVIRTESQEWNKHPIVDVITTNATTCPENHEQVTGIFFGTRNYCNYIVKGYTVGSCKRKQGLYTTNGLDPSTFKKFDNSTICIKRDTSLDYHQLATMRDSRTCSLDSGCGSSIYSDKRFCLRGTAQCPPNSLLTYLKNQTQMTPSMMDLNSQYFKEFNRTNAINSPISGVRFAISRPCADLSKNFVRRQVKSHRLL